MIHSSPLSVHSSQFEIQRSTFDIFRGGVLKIKMHLTSYDLTILQAFGESAILGGCVLIIAVSVENYLYDAS
jgi:hypothetical protein